MKTEPSVSKFEDKLSGRMPSLELYKEALEELGEEGYVPKSLLLKRSAIPPYRTALPMKLLADFDPQLDGADMVFLLREKDES